MVELELKYKILRVSDTEEFKKMAYALYEEDSNIYSITEEKLKATIQESVLNKEHLKIILLWLGDEIIGYCIVVTYWSNRLGGNLIHIDEIYLKPEFRNKGYGKCFMTNIPNMFLDAVAMEIQVPPSNLRALALYRRLNFARRQDSSMLFIIE